MVIRVQPDLLVRVERALLRSHPEPLEQEERRSDELLRQAVNDRLLMVTVSVTERSVARLPLFVYIVDYAQR